METNVKSFGEKLKKERERKKITLEDVANATKISTRMLRALEEEKFHQLPGGIFNKGFVRAYARHLGINEERALADYVKAVGVPAAEEPEGSELRAIAERKEKEKERLGINRKAIGWELLAVLLLLVCLGLAVWSSYSREKVRDRRPHSASLPIAITPSSKLDRGTSPSPVDHAYASPLAGASNGGGANLTPVSAPEPTSASAVDPSLPAPGAFQVLIQARENSWLSVTADGKLLYQDTFTFPQERTFSAARQMTIRATNIGGLEFSFNGTKLKPQGGENEVKTLTFGSEGLESLPAESVH